MASIYANGSRSHHKFTLTLTETGTSQVNNTSTVSFSFVLSPVIKEYDWRYWSDHISYSIVINGTTYTGSIPDYDGVSTVTLKSGTQTVVHNDDGTKTINYSFSVTDKAGKTYTPGNASASGTLALTDIARASTVSCSTVNIGQNPTITINRGSSAFTHTLKYKFYGLSGTIVEKTTATSYTGWTLPTSFYAEIPDDPSGTGTITCETYNGSTLLGTSSCSFTANVNSTQNAPTISPAVRDSNDTTYALTGDRGKLVQYFSTASVTTNAEAQGEATITEQTVFNGGVTKSGGTCTFPNVESASFSFYAKDSRGNETRTGLDLSARGDFVYYTKLTCNLIEDKPDASGNMTVACSGNYFNDTFGAVANTLTVEYRIKPQGGSYGDWQAMTVKKKGNAYDASVDLTGLNYQTRYVVQCRATDKLSTVPTVESSVKSTPVFHWGENDFVFEVPVTFNAGTTGADGGNDIEGDCTITGDCHITGDLRLQGGGDYGNRLRFGDGDHCYISEDTDDVMTIKASRIDLEANGVYAYGEPILVCKAGRWTPSLNSSAVSSYSVREGWYQKIGQCVTIGFQVKATINSGYNSVNVSITGVPYKPMFAAFGGGVAFNIYVSAGFNFECWSISDTGVITARVQPCNNTSAGNLNIASSCGYPSGGGEVTLAGTICYFSTS